jgi:hypothetical protein
MSGVLQGALEDPAEREKLRQIQITEQARRRALQAQQEQLRRFKAAEAQRQANGQPQQNEAPQTDDD